MKFGNLFNDKRLTEIYNKIYELARNNNKILTLANNVCCGEYLPNWSIDYFLYKYYYNVLPYKNSQACGCVALAIMGLNFFDQIYIKNIHSFDILRKKLKNNKESTFLIGVGDQFFKIKTNNKAIQYFPGHSFVIIKFRENKNTKYILFQSYINHYSLSDFIDRYKYGIIYNSFEELDVNIIKPFQYIIVNKIWNIKNAKRFYNITGIETPELLNYSPIIPLSISIKKTTKKRPKFSLDNNIEYLIRSIIYTMGTVISAKLLLSFIQILKLLTQLYL
jgi:hypothetical protein